MNMTWIDKLQQWIESKAGYLAFTVLLYNIIMFILHIVDLSTGNNPNNICRTAFALICRLTVRFAQFWNCKKTNQPHRLHTRNAHWNQGIRSNIMELQQNNLNNLAIQHIT